MLLNNTGLPAGYEYVNANASTSTFNIPELPAPYLITATEDPGIFYAWYGSPHDITQAEVEADVTRVIETLRATTNSTITTPPEFIEFRSHTPFKLVVSAEEITDGFYQKLGKRKSPLVAGFWENALILSSYSSRIPQYLVHWSCFHVPRCVCFVEFH